MVRKGRSRKGMGRALAATTLVAAIGAAGCGSSDGGSKGSAGSASTTGTKSSGGALIYNLQNVIFPYISAMNSGVNKEAKTRGLKVVYANANGSATAAISQIRDAVAAGAKGIVIEPVDSVAIVPAIESAIKAGVCVVSAATPIGPKTGAVYPGAKGYVGWDEHESGALVADAIAKSFGGKGDVAIIVGTLTNGTSKDRAEGMKQEWAKKWPGVHVVALEQDGFDVAKARSQTLALITRYGASLKGLFVETNPGAISAVQAINTTPYKSKIAVGSIGGEGQYQSLIRQGLAAADVPEAPVSEGSQAVQLVDACIKGDKSPVFFPEQKLPPLLALADQNYTVTKENVDAFHPEW
jgi:ABC-type sugar transport system substrate-binding protein